MLSQCRARRLVFYSALLAAKVAQVVSSDNRGNDHPLPEVSEQADGGVTGTRSRVSGAELGDSYQPTPCRCREASQTHGGLCCEAGDTGGRLPRGPSARSCPACSPGECMSQAHGLFRSQEGMMPVAGWDLS